MIEFVTDIRKTPIFRQLVPLEAGIGWPIPLRRNKNVYVTLPFYGFSHTPGSQETALYAPFAMITVLWSNQLPVEYVNLHFRNLWPKQDWEKPVGTFPHQAVSTLSVKQYNDLRSELLGMYDTLLETLARNESLTPEWKASFSLLLRVLMEPPLEPYYRTLGEKFFGNFLPALELPSPSV